MTGLYSLKEKIDIDDFWECPKFRLPNGYLHEYLFIGVDSLIGEKSLDFYMDICKNN